MIRMKLLTIALLAVDLVTASPVQHVPTQPEQPGPKHLRPYLEKRAEPQFLNGQPIDGKGKGAPILGMYRP